MAQIIPFTIEHDQIIRGDSIRLGVVETKLERLSARVGALEVKVDALEVKVDALEVKMDAGFRRADVLHEELRSMFNNLVDIVMHMHDKLDKLIRQMDRLDNHEVRIGVIESHLKKQA